MESKSQKAALAAINEKKKYLIREIKSLQLHGSSSQDVVMDNCPLSHYLTSIPLQILTLF
jgi:hypothetical protein